MRVIFGIDPFRFFFGIVAICLSLGFVRYYNRYVYFPWFPNSLDSAVMAVVGIILLYDVVRNVRRKSALEKEASS